MDLVIPDAIVIGHEEMIAGLTIPDVDDQLADDIDSVRRQRHRHGHGHGHGHIQ